MNDSWQIGFELGQRGKHPDRRIEGSPWSPSGPEKNRGKIVSVRREACKLRLAESLGSFDVDRTEIFEERGLRSFNERFPSDAPGIEVEQDATAGALEVDGVSHPLTNPTGWRHEKQERVGYRIMNLTRTDTESLERGDP